MRKAAAHVLKQVAGKTAFEILSELCSDVGFGGKIEYFVNTVSRAGLHHVGEIWRYRKRWVDGSRPVYDYEYPVPADDPDAAAVGRYALGVLDALEISNGAAHAEVMLTEAGPVLVECNARLCGTMLPQIVSRCLGTNQVELLALSIAAPDEFARLAGTGYRLATHLRYVSLISPRPGIVPSHAELAPVRALPRRKVWLLL